MSPFHILRKDTGIDQLVGTATKMIELGEGLMQMGELQVDMSVPEDLEERGWEFTGIGIKVETLQSE